MTEMIERVARALAYKRSMSTMSDSDSYVAENWPKHVPDARAAIEAMREPTADMTQAATDEARSPTYGPVEADGTWRAMIDAALGEGGAG